MCRECAHRPSLAIACRAARREALGEVYLFQGLGEDRLARLAERMGEVSLDREQWLVSRDQPAERFYLVLEGDLALVRLSPEGDELIVALLGPGELFGEDLVLVEDARHPLGARAIGPCRLASFDRRQVRTQLRDCPELLLRLAETVQRRNTMLLDELERVTIQDASERLLSFLESRTAAGHTLRVPKRVLASRLSIRPETLSRVLGRLKDCQRVLEVDGALVLASPGACATCPARHWGCPGPTATAPTAAAGASAAARRRTDLRPRHFLKQST